jgi:hypothetical protein
MPRIPIYERQVQPGRLPDANQRVRYTPQDASGGLDKAAGVIADVATQQAQKALEEQRSARLMDAYSQLGNARIDIERNVQQLHGKDALQVDLPAMARQQLKTKADEIAQTLPEDIALNFRKMYLREDEGIHRAASDHFARESDTFADDSHNSVIDVATNKAADGALRAATQPPVVRADGTVAPPQPVTAAPDLVAARQEVLAASELRTRRKGLAGTPAADVSRLADLSKFHLAVLDRLTDQEQGAAAKAYLEQYGGEIDAVARGRSNIDKVVAAAGLKDRGRAEADRIWATAGGDPTKALEAARSVQDTALADEVNRRLRERLTEDHQTQLLADAPREGRLEQGIARFTSLDRNSKDYAALSDRGKARIEEKFKAAIRATRVAGSEERRVQAAIDREARADFNTSLIQGMQAGQDPSTLNADELHPDASPAARAQLRLDQAKAKKAWTEDAGVSTVEFNNRTSALAQTMGWGSGKGSVGAQFSVYMKEKRDQWLAENPSQKVPPDDVVRKMFADAILYGDGTGGSMFSRNKFAWQKVQAGEPFVAFPETEQPDKVRAALGSLRAPRPPAARTPGTQVTSEELGRGTGGLYEVQADGSLKRIK